MSLLIAHVTAILVHAWRLAGFHIDDTVMNWSGSASFQRFLQAVELHFREDWPVSRYAGQLGVTERRLHAAVTKAAGKSSLQLLHLRILEAARSRLEQSSLPIAQIGYGLGFSDPARFSRFFKKATGLSPGAFRRGKQQENRRDTTYAAWPCGSEDHQGDEFRRRVGLALLGLVSTAAPGNAPKEAARFRWSK